MPNAAYFCKVTEHESGWGSRPDGYLIALSREAFEAKAREIDSQMGPEFSRTEKPRIGFVTDALNERLKSAPLNCLWVSENPGQWLVDS
jgi:hypothetical protein